MIILTRLGGHEVAVNPDLIERAEATPDTVLTMIDGHKIVIAEPVDEVVELVRTWRATIAAQGYALSRAAGPDEGANGFGAAGRRLTHPSLLPTDGGEPAVRDHDVEDESGGHRDQVSAHAAIDASLARVLRLPQRKE